MNFRALKVRPGVAARIYAACVSEVNGIRLLSSSTLAAVLRPRVKGMDIVSGENVSRDGFGFLLGCPAYGMLGSSSFGHHGAGGACAFADTQEGIAFAFVTDRFPSPAGPDREAMGSVLDSLKACLAEGTETIAVPERG